jgi:flagellar motility protein MotE (MotC chaperone)
MEQQCKANVLIQQADGHLIPVAKLIRCLTSFSKSHCAEMTTAAQQLNASSPSGTETGTSNHNLQEQRQRQRQQQQQQCSKADTLLREQRQAHIRRFIETEAALNTAHSLKLEYDNALQQFRVLLALDDDATDRIVSTTAANSILQSKAILQLIVTESKLAAETAALSTLQHLTRDISKVAQEQTQVIVCHTHTSGVYLLPRMQFIDSMHPGITERD